MSADPAQRPIIDLIDLDAQNDAALEAAKEARAYRKIARLRVVAGRKHARPRPKHKLERWLAEGVSAAEVGGWKGIGKRWFFIACETARECYGWGAHAHALFVARLNTIASKSPELCNASGRSRFAYGRAAERAWQAAKAEKAGQIAVLRREMLQPVLGPQGGVALRATVDPRSAERSDDEPTLSSPSLLSALAAASAAVAVPVASASLAVPVAPATPAGGGSQHHDLPGTNTVRSTVVPVVAFPSKNGALKRALSDVRQLHEYVVRDANLDPLAAPVTCSQLMNVWQTPDRMAAWRRMNRLVDLGLVARLCEGLRGYGGERTRGQDRTDGEDAIFCLSVAPGECVSAERIAQGMARSHVQAQIARVARKVAARAADAAHKAQYQHERIGGEAYCVDRLTGVATPLAIAHAAIAERRDMSVAPAAAHPDIVVPVVEPERFDGEAPFTAAERRRAAEILTAAWEVVGTRCDATFFEQDYDCEEITAHAWRNRNARTACEIARDGLLTAEEVARLFNLVYDAETYPYSNLHQLRALLNHARCQLDDGEKLLWVLLGKYGYSEATFGRADARPA